MLENQPLSTELVKELLKEKRKERRWKNFRFIVVSLFILSIVIIFSTQLHPSKSGDLTRGYVSLVRLNGLIAPDQEFSAENVLPILQDAFKDHDAKGVILEINSPGGTPVQAAIIHDAILKLKKQYHKKVVIVGEDLVASGAYFIAVAGDKIVVNANTITGSIGVIMKGFGFPELIKKIGVERRVITAGINKDRLDPFLPETAEDIEKMRQVIGEVHANFEQVVLSGREGKLKAPATELFSGDFWTGITALKLGLVDEIGNLSDVLEKDFQVDAYRDYSRPPSIIRALAGQMGASVSMALNNDNTHLLAKI